MTEGSLVGDDKPMCVRIWLEVGHACEPRSSALGRSLALDWRVWVRGLSGRDISSFVHKVVFNLHPPTAFVYPKRVIQEPPYEIQESGYASIEIPIHVYLKYSSKPKKIKLKYSLHIENNSKSSSETRCIYYDFENPSEQLHKSLMKGGGEVIARFGALATRGNDLLVIMSDSGDDRPPARAPPSRTHSPTKAKRYTFVEPIQWKHVRKKTCKPIMMDETCAKCVESTSTDFKKLLRSVSMTEDEIKRVSQLYLSYSSYEKSVDALALPPLSDPIYKVPELPLSLRGTLTSVEADYSMQ